MWASHLLAYALWYWKSVFSCSKSICMLFGCKLDSKLYRTFTCTLDLHLHWPPRLAQTWASPGIVPSALQSHWLVQPDRANDATCNKEIMVRSHLVIIVMVKIRMPLDHVNNPSQMEHSNAGTAWIEPPNGPPPPITHDELNPTTQMTYTVGIEALIAWITVRTPRKWCTITLSCRGVTARIVRSNRITPTLHASIRIVCIQIVKSIFTLVTSPAWNQQKW